MMMPGQPNPAVDTYFDLGCGRCPLVATPQCKVNTWRELLLSIRDLMLGCQLVEERKWGAPCYTYQGKNVAIIGAFKSYCSIAFFKGVLLNDVGGLLQKPGENSHTGRVIKINTLEQLQQHSDQIRALINQAIEIEKQGIKPPENTPAIPIPAELQSKFEALPELGQAFRKLSPGRQKEYLIYFSQAKQPATRAGRVERYTQKILSGKGLRD